MVKRVLAVLFLLCTTLILPAVAQRRSDPVTAMFRGGPAHLGYYDTPAGRSLMGLAWRFPTEGAVISSAAIAGGRVYIGSGDGRLYALALETGARIWSYQADAAIHSSPAVDRGAVYFTSRSGRIYALDAATGHLRWFRATDSLLPFPWGHESGDHFISSPVVAGDQVLVGAGDGGLYALAAATGRVNWRGWTGGRVRSSPAVDGKWVYVGSADGSLYSFDLATGKRRWRFDTDGAHLDSGKFGFDRRTIQSSPAVRGNSVFVGARDGFIYAVSADSGREQWRFDHDQSWIITSPAVNGSAVFAASSDAGFVQALDAATGKELWHKETGFSVWSSPAITRTALLVGDRTGRVMGLDRTTGEMLWHFQTGGTVMSSPVVAGNLVVFGGTDGVVYAIRIGDGHPPVRAFFFDSTYQKASSFDSKAVTAYLSGADYTGLNESQLGPWLEERIADPQPSTLVFAVDYLPKSLATEPLGQSILRRYLNAGGKVVWPGAPPLLWPRDPATGQLGPYSTMRYDAPGQLLGVPHDQASFDFRGTRPTAAGVRAGLGGYWRDTWSVDPRSVSTVLAADEWGLASSWIKEYGGGPGTGFARIPGTDPKTIYLMAELRPEGKLRK